MDPDPRSPKTCRSCGSGSGSRSPTLATTMVFLVSAKILVDTVRKQYSTKMEKRFPLCKCYHILETSYSTNLKGKITWNNKVNISYLTGSSSSSSEKYWALEDVVDWLMEVLERCNRTQGSIGRWLTDWLKFWSAATEHKDKQEAIWLIDRGIGELQQNTRINRKVVDWLIEVLERCNRTQG
jgi:hypothetical protein